MLNYFEREYEAFQITHVCASFLLIGIIRVGNKISIGQF